MMMDVEFIQKLYEREPERVPQELTVLREAAGKTLDQVRNAMFELRPLILETQGLEAALEHYVERQASTEGIKIHLDVRNLDERLPFRMESLCFAIIHEAVGNVKKHAEADNTWIVVERRKDDVVVAIRDDGKGFDVKVTEETYDKRGSLGLLNIRERCQVLGARYSVESRPGRGTLVYLIAPIIESRGAEAVGVQVDGEIAELSADGRKRKRKTGPLDWANTEPQGAAATDPRHKETGPLGWFDSEEQESQ
jgi:signal transduction histidine kinase